MWKPAFPLVTVTYNCAYHVLHRIPPEGGTTALVEGARSPFFVLFFFCFFFFFICFFSWKGGGGGGGFVSGFGALNFPLL